MKAIDISCAALAIAILKPVSVEQAFDLIEIGSLKKTYLMPEDTKDMVKLKNNGTTYTEIGEIYDITANAVLKRVKRYKELNKNC